MNMISTGAFPNEMHASNKQSNLAEKFAAVWEKKNSKAARAGGVSLMALSLAACGSSSTTTTTSTTTTDTTTDTTTTVTAVSKVFTTEIDILSGTSADDTFTGDNGTVSAADQVSGGDGTDTLKVYGTATLPDITSIENLELHHATAVDINIDTGNLSSVSTLTLDGLTINDKTVTIGNGETLNIVDATGAAKDINITGDATTLKTVNIGVENSGDSTHAIDLDILGTLLDVVNITSTGALAMNYINVVTSGTPTITTVNITATGKGLTVEDVDDATTIDMSASTAPITLASLVDKATVTFGSGADTFTMNHDDNATQGTYSMGAGNDKVSITNMDAASTFTDSKITLSGGDGTDTLSGEEALFSGLGALSTTAFAKKGISGFEKIEFDDATANGGSYKLSNFGVNHLIVTADSVNDATVSGVTSGFTLEMGTAVDDLGGTNTTDDFAITLSDRAGAGDELNLVIKNTTGAGNYDLSASELEIVRIDATGSDQANTVDLNFAQVEEIYVSTKTGNVTIDLSATGNAGLNANLVDATGSASTGGVIFTADGSNLSGITFKGGTGGDEFNGGDLSDVVIAGSGDDVIDVGAGGANTVDLSAGGADKIEINSLTGVTTVTGFSSDDDIDIENSEIHAATSVYTAANTGLIDLTNENVLIYTQSAASASLKSGGSETIADFTDMTDVSAYLEEALDILNAEDVGIVLNDGTNSYIYHVDVNEGTDNGTTGGASDTVDATDVTLLMTVENFILTGDHVIVSP